MVPQPGDPGQPGHHALHPPRQRPQPRRRRAARRHLAARADRGARRRVASGKGIKAVLPGGPSSGFLTRRRPRRGDGPRAAASEARPSVVACSASSRRTSAIVEVATEIAEFFAKESCGQCPACSMETSNLAKIIASVRDGNGTPAMLDAGPEARRLREGQGVLQPAFDAGAAAHVGTRPLRRRVSPPAWPSRQLPHASHPRSATGSIPGQLLLLAIIVVGVGLFLRDATRLYHIMRLGSAGEPRRRAGAPHQGLAAARYRARAAC